MRSTVKFLETDQVQTVYLIQFSNVSFSKRALSIPAGTSAMRKILAMGEFLKTAMGAITKRVIQLIRLQDKNLKSLATFFAAVFLQVTHHHSASRFCRVIAQSDIRIIWRALI